MRSTYFRRQFSVATLLLLLASVWQILCVEFDEPYAYSCDHAIVGAGPAGIYYAWRLAGNAAVRPNTTICIFERLERVGGRVASLVNSGPLGDLVVEPGAYRFIPEKSCFHHPPGPDLCMWTPILAGIITDALKLRSKRYNMNASELDYHLFKIVDEFDQDAGFARYVWGMLDEARALATQRGIRLHVFLRHSLESFELPGSASGQANAFSGGSPVQGRLPVVLTLREPDGSVVKAAATGSVLLNLPQLPLMQALAASGTHAAPPVQLHEPNPGTYMKLYIHYSDAWWRGGRYGLNKTTGHFSNLQQTSHPIMPGEDPMHVFPGVASPAPLLGAYHDGDTRCKESSPGEEHCRGYVQAIYTDDFFALMFYQSFGLMRNGEAIANLTRTSHGPAGKWLLDEVHAALVELHTPELSEDDRENILRGEATQPDHAALSIWGPAATGFGAACHFSRLREGMTPKDAALDVAQHTLRPFLASEGEDRVFVASEAFAPLQCWSEGALQMAENALQRLGLEKPTWMPQEVYEQSLFTDADTSWAPTMRQDSARSFDAVSPGLVMGVPAIMSQIGSGYLARDRSAMDQGEGQIFA